VKTPFDDLVEEFTPRPPVRQAWWGFVALVVLIFTLLLSMHFIALAYAQERARFAVDCKDLANQIALAAWARDMRADENLVAIFHRSANRHLGFNQSRAIEREVRRVWHEKQPARKAVDAAFDRCRAQLGDMGLEG